MRKAKIIIIALLIIQPIFASAQGTNYRFSGQELDAESGLYNFKAREYNPSTGRFNQPDPVLNNLANPQKLKEQTGQDLQKFLENPQALNPYSYTTNNPVKYVDPTGEWFQEFLTGKQSWSGFRGELGQAAMYLGTTWQKAMDHPYVTGAVTGVAGGLAALGVSSAITWGLTELGILATQQLLQHGDKVIKLSRNYSSQYLSRLQNQFSTLTSKGLEIGEHALNSMNKKGFSANQIVKIYNTGQKYLDMKWGNINIIKDGVRITIDPNTNKFITNILNISNIDPNRFQLIK